VDIIKTMPLHVKLVLASIYLLSRSDSARMITTGLIYDKYKELVGKVGIEPVTSRRVSDIINELDMTGIINAKVISLGRYGRTKVVSLGVPARNVEEGLMSDLILRSLIENMEE
ncbi:MAG: cell division control protein Cdc6, partial [Thermofilaceae archaeon]